MSLVDLRSQEKASVQKVLATLWQKRRAMLSTAMITVIALTISVLAFTYEGIKNADLKLDDGGVWVTKENDLFVGHLNYPSHVLDGAARVRPGEFDVLQYEDTVLVHSITENALTVVDPASIALGEDVALPADAALSLGNGLITVTTAGQVFGVETTAISQAVFEPEFALLTIGEGAAVTAKAGDRIFAISRTREQLLTVDTTDFDALAQSLVATPDSTDAGENEQNEEAEPAELEADSDPDTDNALASNIVQLPGIEEDAQLSITAVGHLPVAFDSVNGVIFLPSGESVTIPESVGGVLQQVGDYTQDVIIAAPDALVRQPLDGSAYTLAASVTKGIPAAPVQLGTCAYAVWSGSAAFVRDCDNDSDDAQHTIETTADQAKLTLRANRRVVVVNDTLTGTVWLVNQDMVKVDNWDDLIPPPDDDSDDEESEEEQPQFDIPERNAENRPPTANDDEYGVRAGRTTILNVTENDTDPDGDLLSASLLGDIPDGYTVQPVLGGAALQLAVPETASGTMTFRYQIEDGRGGTDDAQVRIQVRPPEVNSAPDQRRVHTVQVEANGAVTASALEGWFDPDGDDFYLQSASVEGGDTITYRSNGVLEYRAASGEVGLKEVILIVSDGRDEAEGILRVDVRPAGTLNPIANADRVTAVAGVPVTVAPLANDVSPSGAQLRLAKHDHVPGATITPDFSGGTFDFVSDTPGTYYVQYLVTDGPRSAVGIIRIDVVADDVTGLAPIAARDLALLPTGREVLVDVLANDYDPAGGILVVQSAQAAPNAGVSVEVLEHSVLRVSDLAGLIEPVTLTYTVSNGQMSATGEVLVMPVALPEVLRAPVTRDDHATVHVGDVVNIPVLENDSHPDGDVITLLPTLVETDVSDRERIFVDGNRVRFHAGTEPGTVHATYEIEDSQQNRTAGYITIQILPAVDGQNSPPRPKPVVARAIAGNEIRIAIPTDGIDPDGDSVELVGLATNPSKGRATIGEGWITYRAHPSATGRDTFSYEVRDHRGAKAVGTITVGIAPPGIENLAPYAVKDVVIVKPGRQLLVPVTVNDSDPDGDEIMLVADGLTAPEGLDVAIVDGRVALISPEEPGDYTITYTISDTYGAEARGVLLVQVDPNAPAQAPIARDDRVRTHQITVGVAHVEVLNNDEDPDGSTETLRIEVYAEDATVNGDIVSIPVLEKPRIVRYSITDEDGLSGQAFIYLPGATTLVPVLVVNEPVEVMSGETIEIPLSEYVIVRDGREPRIAVADTLHASHSNGEPLLKDEFTLQYTSSTNYYGPDALGVLVTDGTGPDDPEGLTAYLSIPITVLPATQQSPTLRNATVTIEPGEGAAELDLLALADDPDEGDMKRLKFTVTGDVPQGYTARIDGSTMTISAADSVPGGDSVQITVEVTDGTTAPGTGIITVETVASERPLPVANDDTVTGAAQGRTESVDVLANDYNPYADSSPLTILSARVDSGSGEARVAGGRVEVTPGSDFVGTMVVTYRIVDETGATEREAQARIFLTVQGRPSAPGVPTVTSIQDSTVVLSWAPSANNGSPITHYNVQSPQGAAQQCASTTCTITNLTNDVEYTFSVTATNDIGESDPSPMSASARPDARPDTPTPPTLQFGDRALAVEWVTPHSSGSPVQSYNLEISPAPATGPIQKTGVTGNSLVWEGLQNGVAYQVRVQAVNRAPDPSDWSPYSATMVPAGVPDAPGQPVGTVAPSVGSQSQVNVSWAPPANENGDPVADYTVTVTGGDGQTRTQTVTGTSANFTVGTSTSGYVFSVVTRNKAGQSPVSPQSAPVRAANAPGAPVAVTISSTASANQLSYQVTAGAMNGNAANEVTWHWSSSAGASGTLAGLSGTITNAPNGQNQTISVWGVSGIAGKGDQTTSNSAKPYGPLLNSTVTSSRNGDRVCFTWDLRSALNGQEMQSVSYSVPGGDSGSGNINGQACSSRGYYKSHTFSMTLTTVEGANQTYTASGSTGDNPNRTVAVKKGGAHQTGQYVEVRVTGFKPNTTYTVNYWTDCKGTGQGCSSIHDGIYHTKSVTTNSNGDGQNLTGSWFGFPGAQIWAEVDDIKSSRVKW